MLRHWRFRRALRSLAQSGEAVFAAYAAADWPDHKMPVTEARLLALDFELDGLKRGAHVLQAGWIPFSDNQISLSRAQCSDVRSGADLDRSAVTVHGIGSQRALQGEPIDAVLHRLLTDLAGRVIVAHGASIEVAVVRGVARKVFGIDLPVRSICTLAIERHLAPGQSGDEAYRLGPTRQRYGLPAYEAHDALGDALAAAELLQAQLRRMPLDTTLGRLEAFT